LSERLIGFREGVYGLSEQVRGRNECVCGEKGCFDESHTALLIPARRLSEKEKDEEAV
jgi:hypothetical protein